MISSIIYAVVIVAVLACYGLDVADHAKAREDRRKRRRR